MDYRDNPHHRVLHHIKWCIFTPADWCNFSPALTRQSKFMTAERLYHRLRRVVRPEGIQSLDTIVGGLFCGMSVCPSLAKNDPDSP